jgi:hypothetical protein
MRDKCMAYYATCDSAKARIFRKELQQGVSRCLLKLASDGIKKDTIDIKQDTTTIKADTGSILLRLAGHVPRPADAATTKERIRELRLSKTLMNNEISALRDDCKARPVVVHEQVMALALANSELEAASKKAKKDAKEKAKKDVKEKEKAKAPAGDKVKKVAKAAGKGRGRKGRGRA